MPNPLALLVAFVSMAGLMSVLWFVQRQRGNAGIVDVAWSFGTGLCAAGFCWAAEGDSQRRWIVASLALVWGVRLGIALIRRLLIETEDGRYLMLKEKWGDSAQAKLFGFFQIQAFWAVLFALPMYGAAMNPSPLGVTDYLGVGIWVIAIGMEWVADRQLFVFKSDHANKGKVCRVGLWSWSRHPNYFFEWTHWFAYLLMALGGPGIWLAVGGVLVMLFFLTKVTGIPMTERRAVESRGDAYRQYQREVSPFIPLPPRQKRANG